MAAITFESADFALPISSDFISCKDEPNITIFKKITSAKTLLIHNRGESDILYTLILGQGTVGQSHSPIILSTDEIDEYKETENLVIRDIRISAPAGATLHVRITKFDRP